MKLKTTLALTAALLVVIFSLQNSALTPVTFLFWSFETYKVLILLGSFIIGVLVGMLIAMSGKNKSKKAHKESD
jgi:uncharacterized integral membrane protein